MQNHYNLAYREEEREMIPLCQDQGVALIPWSPLARGFLAGNRQTSDKTSESNGAATATATKSRPVTDAAPAATERAKTDSIAQNYYYRASDFEVVQVLGALALEKGVSNASLAYAWLLHKGVTAPIVGASKSAHLEQAAAALEVKLSPQEMGLLEAAYSPHPVLGHS